MPPTSQSQRDASTPTRRSFLHTAGVTAIASASGTTAALYSVDRVRATGSSRDAGILADGLSVEDADFSAFMAGLLSRYRHSYRAPPTAETLADRMRNEFTANEDLWLDYAHWLIEEADARPLGSATLGVDVVLTRGRWPTVDDREETTVEVTFDEGKMEFSALEWRLEPPEMPDYRIELRNHAAENAADELQSFRREFIDSSADRNHTVPDAEYLSELAGKYGGAIGFGERSENVLELLLGDLNAF
ncbi:hypothetical protein [Natronocalculus amylovorans]|uniref:Uncharacterized protein n=1 Tax=Natronocalculus amylovorans TaxID=2917812 RepID=A0AAE3KDH6_9EURY|nr:hypothetical protein [Natronocalculus amylovorans]MCL9818324.1 hypothetical protein [Natronocalculus amylovorans]